MELSSRNRWSIPRGAIRAILRTAGDSQTFSYTDKAKLLLGGRLISLRAYLNDVDGASAQDRCTLVYPVQHMPRQWWDYSGCRKLHPTNPHHDSGSSSRLWYPKDPFGANAHRQSIASVQSVPPLRSLSSLGHTRHERAARSCCQPLFILYCA